jgi:peptidoglycan/xylan/chitin deacetylase (PgdA/CDA1 family)
MTGDPELLFTFDDGPDPVRTTLVLDLLAKHDIQAVFFLVGRMAAHKQAPELIARMLREGHVIANHTMTHQDLCRLKDEARAAADIDDGKAAIEAAAGMRVVWFRTPYGVRCDRVDTLLRERSLGHFHWDLDPQEWRHNSAPKTVDYVTRQLGRMTGRNVLLLHDIKKVTVDALPEILDFIAEENRRRRELRIRRIRILKPWDIAAERLPRGLTAWLAEAVPHPRELARAIAQVLP